MRAILSALFCLATFIVTGAAQTNQPAPRWPDGRVRLGAPTSTASGFWMPNNVRPVLDLKSNPATSRVAISGTGLLANPADADRVAPFMPWSKAVFLYRQQTKLKDDPVNRCLPPGGPRQFQSPQGFQLVEQRDLGRILVLHGGGNRNWRVIHTDGRPLGAPAEAVPSYFGHSVGRWEKDTLVVESIGYNERFWMGSNGVPHTEALKLTERFTRPTLTTLRYEVTIDDPRTYTRPWTAAWTLTWVADREIPEYFCEEEKP